MKDPYSKLEQSRYEHPVPSREAIINFLNSKKSGATIRSIAKGYDRYSIELRLKAMVRDGQISLSNKKYFALPSKVVAGYVIIRKDDFGLLNADTLDIILPPRQAFGLVRGDYVRVRTTNKKIKGKILGVLIETITRSKDNLVGVCSDGVVELMPGQLGGAKKLEIKGRHKKNNLNVLVKVEKYPTNLSYGQASIVSYIDDNLDMRLWASMLHGLPYEFSNSVKNEASKLKIASTSGRKDLRALPFVTIDGEDAKDFDDAIYVTNRPNKGWLLYVAIADVSEYVKPNTNIDDEARLRGTSVYFPGQVIPMLPEELSNDLCSLLPKKDRAVLVAEMAFDDLGNNVRTKVYKAMICSHARFTYTQVSDFVARGGEPSFWQAGFQGLQGLCKVLKNKKQARGALEISRSERLIQVNANGNVDKIYLGDTTIAHSFIELCMLEANEAVAKFMVSNKIPCMFREHGKPKVEKYIELIKVLENYGVNIKPAKQVSPYDFQRIINELKAHKMSDIFLVMLLRSLPQASYTSKLLGHFGLAYENYCHFTSPIRRYPDLWVHRQISNYLAGAPLFAGAVEDLAKHCSFVERRADQAARDVCKRYALSYLDANKDQLFSGIIISVLEFGFFVELDTVGVEGLVHVSALGDDNYIFYDDSHVLLGQYKGGAYSLGDRLEVKVSTIDFENMQINFNLAD